MDVGYRVSDQSSTDYDSDTDWDLSYIPPDVGSNIVVSSTTTNCSQIKDRYSYFCVLSYSGCDTFQKSNIDSVYNVTSKIISFVYGHCDGMSILNRACWEFLADLCNCDDMDNNW